MLVARCPQCGNPVPVALQHPERMQCPSCEYEGEPPPEVQPYLQAALGVLTGLRLRHRQLTNLQKRALHSNIGALTGYLAFAVPFLVVFLCCGAAGLAALYERPGGFLTPAVCCLLPAMGMVLGVVVGFVALRRSSRRLKAVVVAVPPMMPGGMARCHLCGAGLEGEAHQSSASSSVLCSWSPTVMRAVSALRFGPMQRNPVS